jgi:hypothetical protein
MLTNDAGIIKQCNAVTSTFAVWLPETTEGRNADVPLHIFWLTNRDLSSLQEK